MPPSATGSVSPRPALVLGSGGKCDSDDASLVVKADPAIAPAVSALAARQKVRVVPEESAGTAVGRGVPDVRIPDSELWPDPAPRGLTPAFQNVQVPEIHPAAREKPTP